MGNLECDRTGRIGVGVVDGSPSAPSVRDTIYGRAVHRVVAVITWRIAIGYSVRLLRRRGFSWWNSREVGIWCFDIRAPARQWWRVPPRVTIGRPEILNRYVRGWTAKER